MSWFCTSAFHFELPGDDWEERTLNFYRPNDDAQSVFIVGRAKIPEGGAPPATEVLASIPLGEFEEREILSHQARSVGPLDGEDLAVFARAGTTGQYYRFVSVPYYDLEVTFQFSGPMAARDAVDARVEATLESVQFRKR